MPTSTELVMDQLIETDYFNRMLESLTIYPISQEVIANVTNTVVMISLIIVGMIPIAFALRSILRITLSFFKADRKV